MPFSRVVDLAAHENGTGSVAEGARFVMRVRVIFVGSGRRHFLFYFCFGFYFTVYFLVYLMRCWLVGWIGILMMMMIMFLVGRGLAWLVVG